MLFSFAPNYENGNISAHRVFCLLDPNLNAVILMQNASVKNKKRLLYIQT